MLALRTGWKPADLRTMSRRFVAACRWALYVERLLEPNRFGPVEVPRDATPEARLAAQTARVDQARIRTLVYPEAE